MLVMLDEPKNEQWGSEAAAPIWSAIGRGILRYLEVSPRDALPVQIVTGPAPDAPAAVIAPVRLVSTDGGIDDGSRVMPDLMGRPLRSALASLAPLHLAVEIRGQGHVVRQTPRPGEPLRPGVTARLTLARGSGGSASHAAPRREASDLIR
jgi:cell division protein FtsI (penicillin-binding protein 3)